MRTMYQTRDGELFDSKQTARSHEEKLFEEWLDKCPRVHAMDMLNAFIMFNKEKDKDEYYGTPHELLKILLRRFFENHVIIT